MFYPEIPPNGLSLSPPSTPTPPHGGRISRCNSSFGWYDDVSAFESVDVPQSKAFQIEDWRNLETWDGGRETRESQEVRELCLVRGGTTTLTFHHGIAVWRGV